MDTFSISPAAMAPSPQFPVTVLPRAAWRNGLLVRMPNWLGDAVMAFPALVQLKRLLPEYCGLFVVCPSGLAELFKAMPLVDRVIPLSAAHRLWNWADRRAIGGLQAGAALMFNNSLRDALCFRWCGVPRLYGAAARGRGFLLTRAFNFPSRRDAVLNELHHCNKYLAMAAALGAPAWNGEVPAFVADPDKLAGAAPEVTAALNHSRLLTLAAGAAYGGSKRWPAASFRRVAGHWIDQGGLVAVLGSKSEAAIGGEVIAGLPAEAALNLAGQTNFHQLVELLRHSRFCVANDSGLMHLSAALGRPGLAVFGPTDPSSTAPISARWDVLFDQQPCAPCFKRECPRGDSVCMTVLRPETVIERLDARMNEESAP